MPAMRAIVVGPARPRAGPPMRQKSPSPVDLDDAGEQEEQHPEQAVVDIWKVARGADVVHDEDPEADQAHLRDRE